MNQSQVEEIDALRSIFCKEGELLETPGVESYQISISLDLSQMDWKDFNTDMRIVIEFLLTPDYPENEPPKIFIRCSSLPQAFLKTVELHVNERASTLFGEVMIMDLFCLAQELLEKDIEVFVKNSPSSKNSDIQSCQGTHEEVDFATHVPRSSNEVQRTIECQSSKTSQSNFETEFADSLSTTVQHLSLKRQQKTADCERISENYEMGSSVKSVTSVLHLDHMRSRQGYVKLIKKWTSELSLTGRLIFCQRFIFIILQGDAAAVKEYVVRNRTSNVDVDSKGRSCKERMLSVVCEISSQEHEKFPDFAVLDMSSTKDLRPFFESYAMVHVFEQYVRPLVNRQAH